MIFEFLQNSVSPVVSQIVVSQGDTMAFSKTTGLGTGELEFAGDTYSAFLNGLKSFEITKNKMPFIKILPKCQVTKKILFLPIGFEYYEMTAEGRIFNVYESGFGGDEHYYSVYDSLGNVVAVIHKPVEKEEFKHIFICYLERDDFFIEICLYCLFLQVTQFNDAKLYGTYEYGTETITSQKELRDKYNPNFISKIKNISGVK